jgi:hypothetical protein
MRFDERRDGREGTYIEGKDATKSQAKKQGKAWGEVAKPKSFSEICEDSIIEQN